MLRLIVSQITAAVTRATMPLRAMMLPCCRALRPSEDAADMLRLPLRCLRCAMLLYDIADYDAAILAAAGMLLPLILLLQGAHATPFRLLMPLRRCCRAISMVTLRRCRAAAYARLLLAASAWFSRSCRRALCYYV